MKAPEINLAILSPNDCKYSETFIRAHKDIKARNVYFFYGDTVPTTLQGWGYFGLVKDVYNKKSIKRFLKVFNLFGFLTGGLQLKEYLLYKALKKYKVNVVLAEYGYTALSCMEICQKLGVPLITHFHGKDLFAPGEDYKRRYSRLFEISNFIVVVSKEMEKYLLDLGVPASKIVYSPCGPNAIFHQVKPKRDNLTFLSVGRFVDKKAPYFTILAINEALKVCPDIKLKMAGDGPLLNSCKNLVTALGINESVEFLGVQTNEKIKKLHEECFAYIQHSIRAEDGDKEGTPVGIMEAMASSLPVIATRHGGIVDVVAERESGLLCDEGDFKEMALNIIKLVKAPEEAEKMGLKGREIIENNFTLQRHLDVLHATLIRSLKD